MSITDELRKYVAEQCSYLRGAKCSGYNKMLEIADRIDERHEEIIYEYRREYEDFKSYRDIAYVELPVDADGVSIHIGDELTNGKDMPAKVRCMMLAEDGWMVSAQTRPGFAIVPSILHHVKPDSWERIIRDAIEQGYPDKDADEFAGDFKFSELVERCKKLAEKESHAGA